MHLSSLLKIVQTEIKILNFVIILTKLNITIMIAKNDRKAFLVILDGWGIGGDKDSDAIYHANTEYFDGLLQKYANTTLKTHGLSVGLPKGQMGNSEVGHLNIGAGRVVYQELQRIHQAIKNEVLKNNEILQNTFKYALENKKALHLIGIFSDGGVHGHIDHLKALIEYAEEAGLKNIYVHGFTDGRDTDPNNGEKYLIDFLKFLEGKNTKLASLTGRFYAMDRDKRWDRIAVAYNALIKGEGEQTTDMLQTLRNAYKNGKTDEFLSPIIYSLDGGNPITKIQENDAVICYNFRTDRCREITEALTQIAIPTESMEPLSLHYVTMTEYDASYRNVEVIFKKNDLQNTLGEILSHAGKKQLRIAETEKYPHVTFFFSGGREEVFKGEKRILIPSPKDVATYDLKPEMSAFGITEAILKELEEKSADFICLNYANADMVGHTGVWEAAIKACETVDICLSKIVPKAIENDYALFIIADHGNSDYMINADGSPNTAHTTNLVPFIFIPQKMDLNKYVLKTGKLADIAPSILNYMNIEIPEEMTGQVLIEKDGKG